MTALGGPYGDPAILKARMGIPDSDTSRDADIASALAGAADTINRYCNRQFGRVEVATERQAEWGPLGLDVDDFWTTDDLVIAGNAYSSSLYTLEPVNGIRDGVPGWPYERIRSVYSTHPIYAFSGYLIGQQQLVAARWGWAAVPANVTEASYLLAADDVKSSDAPFGVAGFGDYVVRVRSNPRAAEKLDPYVRDRVRAA